MNAASNVCYLMISHDRREGLLANLRALYATDPRADVWVVDNASRDGTADAVRAAFPRVRLIQLDRNIGMPARNAALRQMRSDYVVLLDDDSHPLDDAIARSIALMVRRRDVAAVVGGVRLPDGRAEAPAMPGVLLGGASCVRLRALRDVGFFPHDFFRQAEEYDLSLRLWNAGHRVERCEDACYRHNKSTGPGRANREVVRLDLLHNLVVAARYLPVPFDRSYWDFFKFRYGAMMASAGPAADFDATVADAERYVSDARRLDRQPLCAEAFEAVFGHDGQRAAVAAWSRGGGGRSVVVADVSKNLIATLRACSGAGLRVSAIADDRAMFGGASYGGVPIVPYAAALRSGDERVVISNTNPAQIEAVASRIGVHAAARPLRLWTPADPLRDRPVRLAA